jgi:hypothetical protein
MIDARTTLGGRSTVPNLRPFVGDNRDPPQSPNLRSARDNQPERRQETVQPYQRLRVSLATWLFP